MAGTAARSGRYAVSLRNRLFIRLFLLADAAAFCSGYRIRFLSGIAASRTLLSCSCSLCLLLIGVFQIYSLSGVDGKLLYHLLIARIANL